MVGVVSGDWHRRTMDNLSVCGKIVSTMASLVMRSREFSGMVRIARACL